MDVKEKNRISVGSYPRILELEVNLACDIRCIYCWLCEPATVAYIKQLPPSDKILPLYVLQKISRDLLHIESVSFGGLGEILCYPHLWELIELMGSYAKDRWQIITHGLTLNEKLVKAMLAAGIKRISISLDSPRKETYEKIRRGGSFQRLIDNIQLINYWKGRLGTSSPRIIFIPTLIMANLPELPELVQLAYDLNVYAVCVNMVEIGAPLPEEQYIYNYPAIASKYLEEAQQKAKELGICLFIPTKTKALIDYGREKGSHKLKAPLIAFCDYPFRYMRICADGSIKLCCYQYQTFGNIKSEDLKRLWNSAPAADLRRQFFAPVIPEICQDKACRIDLGINLKSPIDFFHP